jgi:hypothetical protein
MGLYVLHGSLDALRVGISVFVHTENENGLLRLWYYMIGAKTGRCPTIGSGLGSVTGYKPERPL